MASPKNIVPTSSHWGNYLIETDHEQLKAVHHYDVDTNPTPIRQSLLDAQDPQCRIPSPMIRQGYYKKREDSNGSQRGKEPFVPVTWEEALDIAASALGKTREKYGNAAIYGGSYGWSSAGRFHHAQSQVHRFLNTIGGYTFSINSYSAAAAEVIIPHVLGIPFHSLMLQAPTVDDMVKHTGLVVSFGGIAMKNTQVMAGGLGGHTAHDQLARLKAANIEFVNVSPLRDDMCHTLRAEWWPCVPNSDVAIMLGIAHTLVSENLHDSSFLAQYTTGFERFHDYLMGNNDGQPKDAHWAAQLSQITAEQISRLARRMSKTRTVIGISWSLQRSEHGEQTYWMATTLAAMLGLHGLPGGGVAYGYGSVHNIGFGGRRLPPFQVAALPQGKNPVRSFIPVARISDMLLNPGQRFEYNGNTLTYPDIKLVYWAGGNPFHHHQDLNRMRMAWAKPETIIVNEPFWTAAARHADIVFPTTTPLERNDVGLSSMDCYLTPMRQAVPPFEASKNDYDVFAGLAERLGVSDAFTENRCETDWLVHLYGKTRASAAEAGVNLPDFDDFWSGQQISIVDQVADRVFDLEAFRDDPKKNPLNTPSGKIEIFSQTIDDFRYNDCPGHATWFDKRRMAGV